MKKFLFTTIFIALFALGCEQKTTIEAPRVVETTEKGEIEQKTPPKKPEKTGFCQRIATAEGPEAEVVFYQGCFGPKTTQPFTYYLAAYFDKAKSNQAAYDVAMSLFKWMQAMGGEWDLGDSVLEKCKLSHRLDKKGEKITKNVCFYVYRLVKKGQTI